MLAVACIINNIQREFPMYWWTPVDLLQLKQSDLEKQKNGSNEVITRNSTLNNHVETEDAKIIIDDERIVVPDWIALDSEDRAMLEALRLKLHGALRETCTGDTKVTRDGDTL